MVAVQIERLTSAAQLDDILAIEASSFTNPWTREMYLAELENRGVSYCYLASHDGGAAVGFCSFWHVVDEIHINNLAVLPAHRRAGVATALLAYVLAEGARLGARRVILEVRRSNAAAQSLYGRLGFSLVGVRRAYYTKPVEDAMILSREGVP